MKSVKSLIPIRMKKENLKVMARISLLFLLILSACSSAEIPPAPVEVLATPTVEIAQPATSTPEQKEELVYPFYLPLATKPDIPPQTINGVTVEIDWAYVDEGRVALHYTISGLDWPDGTTSDAMLVRISSASLSNTSYSGAGGWNSSYANHGVITADGNQVFVDGALDADEHPNIDLSVDIPVEGPTSVGTFHFDFNVPVLDGIKMDNIDQAVLANNLSMTLKSLILNPSYAQALICFQMPSAVDWGLTASTITIGGREYPFSGGGLASGKSDPNSAVTAPERCNEVGFNIAYDKSDTSITLTVPKLTGSVPEVIDKERVDSANQRLADTGIQFYYVNIDHGGNFVILKQPEGMADTELYPLIWDALAEQYEGPWIFTVEIER